MSRIALNDDELDAMRQRMAAAAWEVFREGGLPAVSFRRLADALGCSHMQPYRCFENKEALLACMRTQGFARMENFMRECAGEAKDPPDRLRLLVQGYIRFSRECSEDYLLLFTTEQPSPETYPELLAARCRVFDMSADAIRDCIGMRGLKQDARLLAHRVWIGLHGLMTLHAANQLVHGYDFDALAEPLLRFLLADVVDPAGSGVPLAANARGQRQPRRRNNLRSPIPTTSTAPRRGNEP